MISSKEVFFMLVISIYEITSSSFSSSVANTSTQNPHIITTLPKKYVSTQPLYAHKEHEIFFSMLADTTPIPTLPDGSPLPSTRPPHEKYYEWDPVQGKLVPNASFPRASILEGIDADIFDKLYRTAFEVVSAKPNPRKRRAHGSFLFMNKRLSFIAKSRSRFTHFNWIYQTNSTEYNKQKMVEAYLHFKNVTKNEWTKFRNYGWTDERLDDYTNKFYKKVNLLIEELILPENKLYRYRALLDHMEETYNKARVCHYKNKGQCNLALEPDLQKIFATSRDPEELEYYWSAWRNATGRKCRLEFIENVQITNEVAKLNNFTDAEKMWNEVYDLKNFTSEVLRLWNSTEPFYIELHAYVRSRLRAVYGDNVIPKRGAIPAHILGDMYAQTWTNIYEITAPYPDVKLPNVTEQLHRHGYTPYKMFRLVEKFFEDMKLGPLVATFWDKSIFERIENRTMDCTPSAWDFETLVHDYRIKMCTQVTQEDLFRIYHEITHIYNFRFHRDLPIIFRKTANPGLFEALADLINLSVVTPSHLKRIGFLAENVTYDLKMQINQLYLTALSKIAILPYSYILDKWRWDIFENKVKPHDYNNHWWYLRSEIQGIVPPVDRSDEDLDAASKYHVIKNVPHIKYFMSIYHQFQFHRRFCNYTTFQKNVPEPKLHLCDIYGCGDCGHEIWKTMDWGRHRDWQFVLESAIDEWWIDESSLSNYFAPLFEWLKNYNSFHNIPTGWIYALKHKVTA